MNLPGFSFGCLGIAGVRKKIGGVGRAKPSQHPHIFLNITAVSNEPLDQENPFSSC
jgi:hypothetical protein